METQNNSNQNPENENQSGQDSNQQDNAQQQNQEAPKDESQQQAPVASSSDIEENKAITYLSYLGLLFLVPLLAKKDSPFAQFHAKQGLVLTIAWFLGSFLYVLFGLGFLIHIALLVFSIMGLVNVHKGEMKDLPIVGDFAKKFNI